MFHGLQVRFCALSVKDRMPSQDQSAFGSGLRRHRLRRPKCPRWPRSGVGCEWQGPHKLGKWHVACAPPQLRPSIGASGQRAVLANLCRGRRQSRAFRSPQARWPRPPDLAKKLTFINGNDRSARLDKGGDLASFFDREGGQRFMSWEATSSTSNDIDLGLNVLAALFGDVGAAHLLDEFFVLPLNMQPTMTSIQPVDPCGLINPSFTETFPPCYSSNHEKEKCCQETDRCQGKF